MVYSNFSKVKVSPKIKVKHQSMTNWHTSFFIWSLKNAVVPKEKSKYSMWLILTFNYFEENFAKKQISNVFATMWIVRILHRHNKLI